MKHLKETNSVTDRLSALCEGIRLRVLRLLETQELSVGEIARVVQLPQSTVSRHLKLLADGGWLVRRTEGPAALYRLVMDDLEPAARALWLTIREQLGESSELAEDARRLASVLAERHQDSVAFFGRVGGEWDDIRATLFGNGFTALSLLSLLPRDWVVADLGCGTGNAAELLGPGVERVVAVDRSAPMLAAADKRLADVTNVTFLKGPLDRLPLEDASVDAAVCLLVLHHVQDPDAAVREMQRVLRTTRNGGVALIVDMHEHDRTSYRHTMGHKHLGFSDEQMLGMLSEAGFAQTQVRDLPSDPEGKGPGLFVATGWVTR